MADENTKRDYRIKELERKAVGMQRQIGILHARGDVMEKKYDKDVRDLQIKVAVQQGVPQNKVAKIYQLSPGRINQIVKKVA